MEHKAKLTISRPRYGDGREKISISVKDVDARVDFLNIEIDCDKFAKCLTGLSSQECDMQLQMLEIVGKIRESKQIEFEIPGPKYLLGDDKIESLAKINTPKGWECRMYFGSKDSFFERDGKYFARTTAYRWVEKKNNSKL